MRVRPWHVVLVLNCVFLVFPLLSAGHTDRHTDIELREGAFDAYAGPASVASFAIFSCVIGLIVCGITAMLTPVAVARRALGIQAAVLLGITGIALFRHHLLMERITRVNGQTFGGFP